MYRLLNANAGAVIDSAEELGLAACSELRASLALGDVSTDGSADVPGERIIDWLLWGWVAHLRSGAQHRNVALFA